MSAIRYELFKWLDMTSLRPVFGVRMKEPGRGWSYIGENGKPCLSYEESEALMFMDFLRLSRLAENLPPKEESQ